MAHFKYFSGYVGQSSIFHSGTSILANMLGWSWGKVKGFVVSLLLTICFSFLHISTLKACDACTWSINNIVDNGNGTWTYNITINVVLGGMDVAYYGFVLQFNNPAGAAPTVVPGSYPATLAASSDNLTGLVGNAVNSVVIDSDWNVYDNLTNVLSYECGALLGCGSTSFSRTFSVTVQGCASSVLFDSHVNSASAQCEYVESTGLCPVATSPCSCASGTANCGGEHFDCVSAAQADFNDPFSTVALYELPTPLPMGAGTSYQLCWNYTTGPTETSVGFVNVIGYSGSPNCFTRTYQVYQTSAGCSTPLTPTGPSDFGTTGFEYTVLPNTNYKFCVTINGGAGCNLLNESFIWVYNNSPGGAGCGSCALPNCGIHNVPTYADRTYPTCWTPDCDVVGPTTVTNCYTGVADATGFLGFANQTTLPACVTRTWQLTPAGSCPGTPIAPVSNNVHGVASGFNPEYTGLTPGASYTLCVTMTVPSGCTIDGTSAPIPDVYCVTYYGSGCVPPTATIADIPDRCVTSTVPITATLASGTTGGAWSINNGATIGAASGSVTLASLTAGTTYTVTYTVGTAPCTATATETFMVTAATVPTFTQIPDICSGATPIPILTGSSTNGINGTWSPATVNNTATGTYTFTPSSGCATTATMTITVNPTTVPTFTQIPPICNGTSPAPTLPTTSNNGITGTWFPAMSSTVPRTYTFTPSAGECATTATMTTTITLRVTPTFTQIAAFCSGTTPPTLPGTSNNGITGTWNPATVNNTTSGTYTFTPTSGECAFTATMAITVNTPSASTFGQIPPICQGATPIPTLPAASSGGISGTWNPATISNTTTGTYTFTPSGGGCASTGTMTVTVTPSVIPTFTQVPPICSGGTLSALPTTSNNGITGTWSPGINNTGTTTYTFTPSGGTSVTNLVTNGDFIAGNGGFTTNYDFLATVPVVGQQGAYGVNTSASNWFSAFQPCTATATTSGGNYMIADGSTANGGNDVIWGQNIAVTPNTSYTFSFWLQTVALPNQAQIEVLINGTSIGTAVAPNAVCTWTLVTFTWNSGANTSANIAMYDRVIINNGNDFGIDDVTFYANPSCASTTTMTIVVNNNPTINVVAGCAGGANSGTITTTATASNGGTLAYTINGAADADGNQTALANNSYIVVVTESPSGCTNSQTATVNCSCPTITVSGAATLCQTAPATTYSQSGGAAGGTWTVTPVGAGTITPAGSFTPNITFSGAATIIYTVAGCVGSLNININAPATPTFSQIPAICSGATPTPTLNGSSTNGISGTWSPAAVSNTTSDTYTFTPSAGQCATTTTMAITVSPATIPSFTQIPAFCSGTTPVPTLPASSTNGLNGTWSPAVVSNIASGTYTFTPSTVQCATTATMTVTVTTLPTLNVVASCTGGPNTGTITTSSAASNGGTLTFTINGVSDVDGSLTALTNNSYTVIVTETPSGCTNSATATVNCSCPTITVSGAATLCQTSSATTYTQSGGAASGTWTVTPVGAGTISAAGSFTPNATYSGAATITYTVAGCVGSLNIAIDAQTMPSFTQIPAICNSSTPIPTLSGSSNNSINGTWSPTAVSNTATGIYTFTPSAGQCATSATMTITVNALPTINVIAACAGGANSGTITTTASASNGGTLTYTINGTADADGNQTGLANNSYTVVVTEMPSGCTNSQTATVNCNCPTITVSGAATLCQTASATTYTQSGGAAGGTWTVTPVGAGTITAAGSFTPNATYSGAATITYTVTGCVGSLNIAIDAQTMPSFTQIPAICNSSTPIPALSGSSNNGINGTWSPTAVSNTATGIYTFTPSAGQCATSATMTITVNALPTINVIAACAGGANSGTITTTASASNGGTLTYTINGTADADGNQTALANNSYTVVVTETPSGCTNSQTATVNCNCPTITVSGAATLCQTASATTYTQSGGAAGGAWTVTPVGAGTITAAGSFTPNATYSGAATITYTVAGCVGSLNIAIDAQTMPSFTQIPAICNGSTPIPALSGSSNNSINGTWSPTAVSNTATGIYTFTPSAGQCATSATMTITVNALPTINVIAACAGGANSGTITTTASASNGGTLTYTINGTADADGNQTALANNSYTVVVTETPSGCTNSQTATVNCNCPTITVSGAATLCQTASATTYTQSGGAAGGAWTVTPVGAGTITAAGSFTPNATYSGAATITYTVAGCVGSLNIAIDAQTMPSFTQIPAICNGSTPIPALSGSSNNGINGTWSPTAVSNTATGIYTFTPSAGQCATSATMTITVNALPTINVIAACAGGANSGTITTTASASNGGTLTYTINGTADADGNQTALANNSYTVVVTETPSGCTNSQTATVNCNCPTITVSGAATLCQTASATTYTQSGGAAGGAWTVTPVGAGTITAAGSFTPNATYSGAATITYTVAGCVGSLNIAIDAQTMPSFTQIPAICNSSTPIPTLSGSSNNSINGTWSPTAVSNTATGIYTFTPSAGQCATSATMTITVNALPTINVIAACAGGANSGTITTTASASNGGTLTYTINGTADADGNQTALANNSYTVVVTETPSGCTNSQTATVNCNCPTITVSGAATLCQTASATTYTQSGGAAGGIWTVTPVGAGTITAAGSFTPNATYSGAATITYTVAGCVGSLNIAIDAQTMPLFTQIPAICNGSTPIPALSGSSNNSINGTWSPTTVSNTATGIYTFTPSAGQCATSATMTITVNALPTINVIAACAGGANSGTITTTASASNGGTLTYTINGTADADGNQTALANNSYTVVVTETPSGCTNSQTATVNCNCPTITVSGAATLCQTASATTYTQSGGAAGGIWTVTPVGAGTITAAGSFTPNATYSGAATITYTVAGCVGSLNIAIDAQTMPSFTQIPAICNGSTPIPALSGSSNNSINGTWSPTAVSNTATGIYTFTPSAGQCATSATMTITVNALPTINVIAACAGGANSGTITTTASASNGGTLTYTINGTADADGNQTALANNSYTVVVTETPSGCTNSQTATVNCNCPTITVSGAATLCQTASATTYTQSGGAAGGAWTVTPVGAGTITAAGSFTPNATYSGAATITYTVAGCVGSLNIAIDAQTMPSFTQIPAICNGSTPIPTLSGSSNNSINGTWSPATVSNTATGTYTFTPAAGQCATTTTLTMTINPGIVAAASVAQPTCGETTGDISVTPSGAGFTYTWSGGLNGAQPQDVPEGIYSVTVTQLSTGCTGTVAATVAVTGGFEVELITNNPGCAGETSGSIILTPPTTNPPYSSTLNGNNIGTANFVQGLAPGNYTLVVEDAMGCVWDSTFTLTDPLPFVIDLGADLEVEYGEEVTIDAFINKPLSEIDTVIWAPAIIFDCAPNQLCLEQTFLINALTPSLVNVIAIDTNGCKATDELLLQINRDFNIYVPSAFSPNSKGFNSIFTIFASANVLRVEHFNIYDRWGGHIYVDGNFEPNDLTHGWDGTHKGKPLNPGVFVYAIVVTLADGTTQLVKGDVTLLD